MRLKRPHGTVNPGGFDLEAWLLQQGLRATGYVHPEGFNARRDCLCRRGPATTCSARASGFASASSARFPDAPYAGVIVALAIGDQRAIPEAQWTVFNRTGIAHLVSISGLHVTVFAAFAGGLAYALARRSVRLTSRIPARKLAAVVGVVAAGGYVLLAGAEVPAVRTFAMLAIAACGLWFGRPGTAGIVWLWALAGVLAWDPWAPLTPGFWLSYGAVALLLYASVGRLRAARGAGLARAHGRTRCARARTRNGWSRSGSTPLTLALFQQVSLIAPVANAVAIPVVTLGVVPLALTGIAMPFDAAVPGRARGAGAADALPRSAGRAARRDVAAARAAAVDGRRRACAGTLWLLAPRGVPGRAWGCPVAAAAVRRAARTAAARRVPADRARRRAGARARSSRRAATRWSTTPGRASPKRPTPAAASSRRSCARRGCAAPTGSSSATRTSTIPAARCR